MNHYQPMLMFYVLASSTSNVCRNSGGYNLVAVQRTNMFVFVPLPFSAVYIGFFFFI